MPELPEVETVRRSLLSLVRGKRIMRVELTEPRIIRHCDPARIRTGVTGRLILGIDRRGKFLLFQLTGELTLVVHLGMSGKLYYLAAEPTAGFPKHTHAIFELDDGGLLVYQDPRQFGRICLTESPETAVAALRSMGPEPLDRQFSVSWLTAALARRSAKLKTVMLDQKIFAGIGNIYADEALFRARLHPERAAASLAPEEVKRLHRAVRAVLRRAIANRGTSISDYVDGHGVPGDFQAQLQVYGRRGEACRRCGNPVQWVRLAGRSSFYCGCCQQEENKR